VGLHETIHDLKVERARIAAAIECLESLAAGRGKKRGRPSAWMQRTGPGTIKRTVASVETETPQLGLSKLHYDETFGID